MESVNIVGYFDLVTHGPLIKKCSTDLLIMKRSDVR